MKQNESCFISSATSKSKPNHFRQFYWRYQIETNQFIHFVNMYLIILIKDPEEEVDLDAIDDTGYELVLPSGAKIGHRSLQRYYKQSLNPDKQLVLRKPSEKMLAHYRLVFFSYLVFQFLLYTYLAHWIQ